MKGLAATPLADPSQAFKDNSSEREILCLLGLLFILRRFLKNVKEKQY